MGVWPRVLGWLLQTALPLLPPDFSMSPARLALSLDLIRPTFAAQVQASRSMIVSALALSAKYTLTSSSIQSSHCSPPQQSDLSCRSRHCCSHRHRHPRRHCHRHRHCSHHQGATRRGTQSMGQQNRDAGGSWGIGMPSGTMRKGSGIDRHGAGWCWMGNTSVGRGCITM